MNEQRASKSGGVEAEPAAPSEPDMATGGPAGDSEAVGTVSGDQIALPAVGLLSALGRFGRTFGLLLGHEAIPQLGAALAYRTIFSLIPILLIAFLMLRLFKDTSSLVEQMLGKMLEQAGLSNIGGGGDFNLQQWIAQRVQEFSGINFTGIGLISAAVLIYGAMGLLVAMEGSFNAVYGGQAARSWSKRLLQYWMIITLGPMLVYASFFAGDAFHGIAKNLAEETGGATGAMLVVIAGYAITVCISASLLLALYMMIPNTRVAFRPALCGALFGGILLELAKNGFAIYVRYAGVKSLYGSLSLLPLFLFWVYITWIIVLFGLRLSYLVQNNRLGVLLAAWRGVLRHRIEAPLAAALPEQTSAPALVDPLSALAILLVVAESFERGRGPIPRSALEAKTGLPEPVVRAMVLRLVAKGLLVRVIVKENQPARYTLAKAPALVTILEVIEVAEEDLVGPEQVPGVRALSDRLVASRAQLLAGQTLADLLATGATTGAGRRPVSPRTMRAPGDSDGVPPPVPA